jgi:diguanylate cyclase (GGDEF)-like protein/PAS domain S-box-containing protein
LSTETAAVRGADEVLTPEIGPSTDADRRYPAVPSGIDFRAILERIPAVTYVAGLGESGAWVYVSPQIESMLGFTADEWKADPNLWFRQIHPEDRGQALEDENFCRTNGEPLCSEYRLMSRDGRAVWVRDEAILVRDEEEQPLYWEGFMVDISGRKLVEGRLHESEVRYRSLFDHAPVGLYRTTPEGKVVEGNRALARILGHANQEALLKSTAIDYYVDPSDRERWKAMMESEGEVRDFEMPLRRADQSVIWVRDSARAIRDKKDRTLSYEGVLYDITQRKQAEWEARQATQQLTESVAVLERRNHEMDLVKDMGKYLQSCPTAERAYLVMEHWSAKLFPGTAGAVFVVSASRNVVEAVATWGRPALGEQTFRPDDCWAYRASGGPHVVEDARSPLVCPHLTEPLRGQALCVPMIAQGEWMGILHLQGTGDDSAPVGELLGSVDSTQRLAVNVAEHLAQVLANVKLRETLRTQSIRDPLTGLFNRRYMEESLDRELPRAERRGNTVGVVMIDLDHFNQFNNTFGHQAGDAVLQAFGELFRSRVRAEDIACRYGGEEFTLILPEAPLEIALARADALRQEIKEIRINQRGQSLGVVTASMGVAIFPAHGRTAEMVLRAADEALYRAKAEGRDRVVVSGAG